MSKIVQISEGKNTVCRATDLTEAIMNVCYELGDGMSVALVIGAIEIVKMQVMQAAEE